MRCEDVTLIPSPRTLLNGDHMSITANISSLAPAALNSSKRSYVWATVLIVLGVAACAVAASVYAGPPVIDPTLVGP